MPEPERGGEAVDPRAVGVVQATLIVGLIGTLFLLAWALANVLLLLFAAIVVAVVLRRIAGLIERFTPVGSAWSLAIATLLLAGLIGAFVYLLGAQIAKQAVGLVEQLPGLISSLGERLNVPSLGDQLWERAQGWLSGGGIVQNVAGYTSGLLGVVADMVLVVVAGIYLAAAPEIYRNGLLKLVPPTYRNEGVRLLDNTGQALRLWLTGQVVAMLLVGVVTTLGLYAIGLPSALALGLIAGLAEFVPLVGPVFSAIPALLVALSVGGQTVFWVLGLYIVVQQLEGNLITPVI